MRSINRRDFLRDSALLGAVLAGTATGGEAEAAPVAARKGNADTLRVAVVGVRGRGLSHVGGFANRHGCVVTTLCDADSAVIGNAMRAVAKAQGQEPRFVQDVRKVIEDKDIDIVSIATPNHWHSLMAIWAIQNGKDVYVEKPVSHNVSEGRRLVESARKYGRICQAGTQIRSHKGIRDAIAFLHAGKLGKVRVARGLCYKLRGSIGKVQGPRPIPKTVDYNLWCGPAPDGPLMRKNLHYDWHWIWDYGNGDLGNQGIHQMDVARWGLGKNELSGGALSVGGRFGYVDDGQTANTQICVFDYGDSELIFEVRGLLTKDYKGAKVGNIFHCSDGYLVIHDYEKATAFSPNGEVVAHFSGGGDHFGNFVQAVRSRKPELLHGDILEGHLSSALCHLGNLSYRLGSTKQFDKTKALFEDDKAAAETLERTQQHLKANGLPIDKVQYQIGRRLRVDPTKEVFVGDKQADALLTRPYRKGFEVPASV
ncbi:MAG: Gfo/Idh/MocA family oxidoreductase [Planctomycetes bacterium]|nr:Gfo/Idh/MocA family oxidoreductase [Planctomycetota bacterium]